MVHFAATYHSEGDGITERAIQIVQEKLRCLETKKEDDWHENIWKVERSMNNLLASSTQKTPNSV
jgi:hypothetical protein